MVCDEGIEKPHEIAARTLIRPGSMMCSIPGINYPSVPVHIRRKRAMLDQPSRKIRRRIRLGLAFAFVAAGGAVAVWSQPRVTLSSAPKIRIVGRVWTRLPGIDVAGLRVQLVKGDQKYPPGPLLGMGPVETDASGRFGLAGELPATSEGKAEIYLHSPPAEDRWTYRPAAVILRPGRPVEGVEVELVEGVEVEGQFVDADRGDPVAPVRVAFIGPGRLSFLGNLAPIRDTDNLGSFRVRLNPGKVEVIAFGLPPVYMKAYPRGFRQTVEVPAGVPSFTLPPLRLRSAGNAEGIP
jgi:hypothetical protein